MQYIYILLDHVQFDIDIFLTHINEHFGTLLATDGLDVPPLDSDNRIKQAHVHTFSIWCNTNFDKNDNVIRLKVDGNTVTILSWILNKKDMHNTIVQRLLKILKAYPSYSTTQPPLWINRVGQISKHPFGSYHNAPDLVTVYDSHGIQFRPEVVSHMMSYIVRTPPPHIKHMLNLSIEYTMTPLKGEQKTKYAVVRLGNLVCLFNRVGHYIKLKRVLMIGANQLSEENKYLLNYVFGPCIEGDGPGQLTSATESFEIYPRHLELATYLANRSS